MKPIKYNNILPRYNTWRHKTFHNLASIDIDQVEIRNQKPVAIIETTSMRYKDAIKKNLTTILNRASFQMDIQKEFAEKLNLPLYLVIYTENLRNFLVYNYNSQNYKEMDELGYMKFIMNIEKGIV